MRGTNSNSSNCCISLALLKLTRNSTTSVNDVKTLPLGSVSSYCPIRVCWFSTLRLERTAITIRFRLTGWKVRGCSTGLPRRASSSASCQSSNGRLTTRSTLRGSAEYTPATSFHIVTCLESIRLPRSEEHTSELQSRENFVS